MKPPNPLGFLPDVLTVLADNVDILPASGGATEDLLRPDQDEVEDMLVNREATEITEFLEDPLPSPNDIYRPTPAIYRNQKDLYRYFIDGSLRTYYLATGIEGTRSFPIELAQIGAAVVERDERGNARPIATQHRILLLIPKGPLGLSDSVWDQLQKLQFPSDFGVRDTTEKTAITREEPTVENLRVRAGGIARNQMHKLEIAMIDETNGRRSDDRWVILDGAVKLDQFIKTDHMIGVAKNFRKDPQFKLTGKKSTKRQDITKILAGLPAAHRTVAFSSHGGQVAFWYVRLRPQKQLDYPLMGVVKVELPRPDQTPVPAKLADILSSALVGERFVTPYGKDNRWHCHLYPISVAETVIKTGFWSKDVLLGRIRWPAPAV